MYFLELCNSSLGAAHKPYYFQMLFSGNRKGVCHFIANTLLNDTKVLVFFILIPLPISPKEAYHEYHYDIFAA